MHTAGGRVSVRAFEKCQKLLINRGGCFVNET